MAKEEEFEKDLEEKKQSAFVLFMCSFLLRCVDLIGSSVCPGNMAGFSNHIPEYLQLFELFSKVEIFDDFVPNVLGNAKALASPHPPMHFLCMFMHVVEGN